MSISSLRNAARMRCFGPWQRAAGLNSLWQRLRLLVITQLCQTLSEHRNRGSAQGALVVITWLMCRQSSRMAPGMCYACLNGRDTS